MLIQTSSSCLSPKITELAQIEAEKVARFLSCEPSAKSGSGETVYFHYEFERFYKRVTLRVFLKSSRGNNTFSGEAYASWS